jgi:ribosomal protein S18 acetylase RimI-like enzyme
MEITEATKDDIAGLGRLLELLFTQEAEFQPDRSLQSVALQQIIDFPERGKILVLREGAALIGMVNLLFTVSTALGGRVALLEDMIVHPEYRGRGAGSELLQAAVNLASACGCRRITLLTDRTNESAQRFYERHGFNISEMVPMRLSLAISPITQSQIPGLE